MAEFTPEQLEDLTGSNSAPDFTIRQLTGPGRTLVLRGRALPYRTPPVEWAQEMREQTDWYAGARSGTKQVLGPKLDPTTITGEWKDKFLGLDETHPQAAIALLNGTRILTAEALAEALETIQDEGQRVQVTWGRRTRTGTIRRFVPAVRRRQDIVFTIEFSWDGKGLPQAALATPQTATASQDTRNGLDRAAEAIRATLSAPPLLAVQGALDDANEALDTVAASALDLSDALSEALGRVRAPFETVQHAQATAERLVGESNALRAEADAIVYETIAVSEQALPFLEFLTQREQMKADALSARAIAIDTGQRLRGKSRAPVRRGVRANEGEDLRILALRHLGSADAWTVLADYNGLVGSALVAGQLVLIPDTDTA